MCFNRWWWTGTRTGTGTGTGSDGVEVGVFGEKVGEKGGERFKKFEKFENFENFENFNIYVYRIGISKWSRLLLSQPLKYRFFDKSFYIMSRPIFKFKFRDRRRQVGSFFD